MKVPYASLFHLERTGRLAAEAKQDMLLNTMRGTSASGEDDAGKRGYAGKRCCA
jgi:hypothetical protein